MQYSEVDLPLIQYGRWFTLGLDVLVSYALIFLYLVLILPLWMLDIADNEQILPV